MSNFETDVKFNDDMLEILDYSRDNFIPTMLSSTSKFLYNKVKSLKPQNILEIGTAVGYSSLVMLKANAKSYITTIEVDEQRSLIAKNNFAKFNVSNNITLINDDGFVAINNLVLQNKKFDFVFLDGPKGQYLKYFELIEKLTTNNATIIVDDVLFNYMVFKEGEVNHKHRAMIKKLRQFVTFMQTNEKYNVTIYNIDEGIMEITKK